MSDLVDYAKDELKRIGMIDSGSAYNDLATKAILDLIKLFDSQGHTGITAPYVINVFSRLAMFKPLSPLTGEDDEWNDVGDGLKQNKRYSAVFKDGKDGTAYNIDGKVFTNDGETWYMCRDSRVNVTFPYVVPDEPEYVYRNKEEVVADKNIYKVGDRVEVMSHSSRHNGKRGVIERALYKVRFDDGSDSAFVESSLAKEEQG